MSLVTHTQPVIWNHQIFLLLLLLIEGCSSDVHKEWHPGVPKVFNFIHRSKAVHVRVDGKGSAVFADPSMSLVNTMSESHGNTGDSYTRSGSVDQRTRGKDKNNHSKNKNKNNTIVASRRTLTMIRKGGCPCFSRNDTVMHHSHKRTSVGKRLKTNRKRVVIAEKHTKNNFFRKSDLKKRKCEAKKRCRNGRYVRKRQLIIRRSDSPSNRLFDITKAKSSTSNDFHTTGWAKQDANVSSMNATMPAKKDYQNDTKALNITKVANVFKESKVNTTTTPIEKIAPAIKDAQFAKILPHTTELSQVAEINLNPFAHMDDDIVPPPSPSTFNKSQTQTTTNSPESVIQRFLDTHEKLSNSSEPRTISYLPNNTIDDLNSLIERASVVSNKLKDNEIKNLANNTILMETQRSGNDEERDNELAEMLRSEEDAMRRKQSKIKLKDTSLMNTRNNTLVIENTKPKKHKNESNVQKGSHKERKRPDSVDLNNSSDANNKSESIIPSLNTQTSNKTDPAVRGSNDLNTTSKPESSGSGQSSKNIGSLGNQTDLEKETTPTATIDTSLSDSSSQTLLPVPQKNISVVGNKRINDTILHADVIETDKNKTNQQNPNKTDNSPPTVTPDDKPIPASSSNGSQPIIPEDGSTHKNVSQHIRQRRVNATKLVINAVLDAVRKEMVNRSISTQQINNSVHEVTATNDNTEAHQLKNNTGVSDNLVESSGSSTASANSVTQADSGGTKETGDAPDGGIPQHTRQRRVNATKVTINAVLEAVRDELFNRLEEENGLKNTSSSKEKSNGTSDVVSAPTQQKQQQHQQQQQKSSSQLQQQQNQVDENSSVTRNESFSIRNSNNTLVSNVSLSSSVKTSGSGTIESHNSTLETAGSSKASFKAVDIDQPAEQVVWENNMHTDEPAKLKDVKLNVDPSAEALYGSHNVLQPIYENFGDFYDRNERLDYRAEPVYYRVESEGGFAHKHRDIPARYWRG